jgi:pimeloyl-ACP methyl ester carboxylesterase
MAGKAQYVDRYWISDDGLRLHYRDYAGPKSKPPILCIPGLTRNARDFEHVAERLAGQWRVICVDLRGRGESASAKDSATYTPVTYLADLEALLADLKIKRFVAFGTSLGGIMTMLLALAKPGRIAGALINDIGPDVEAAGLDRIKAFAGKSQIWPTWVHAARGVAEMQSHAHPDYSLVEWVAFAKRLCRLTPQGRVMLDYDMKIAEPMQGPAAPFDMWPAFAALGSVPLTVLRGAHSDILSPATAEKMVKTLLQAKLVTVPKTGHPPELDEPAAMKAIDALLKLVGK